MEKTLNRDDPVLVEFSTRLISGEPMRKLFEFGYYNKDWCIVYKRGERNMQDALAFDHKRVRLATKEDLEEYWWG